MPVENANFIEELNGLWPLASDPRSEGDDHLRLLKNTLQASFPNTTGAWSTSDSISAGDPTQDAHLVTLQYLNSVLFQQGVRGHVAQNGSIRAGSGFAVIKNGTGWYSITFDQAAGGQFDQSVVVTAESTNPRIAVAECVSATRVDVRMHTDSGQDTDVDFMFVRYVI